VLQSNETFSGSVPDEKYVYYIIAPITKSGIAFLGDENKIAATGKKRIAELTSSANNLKVKVLFAKGEKEITLCGYAENSVSTDKGKLSFDPGTHLFKLLLTSDGNEKSMEVNLRK
jgi:hypothetical protein